MFKHTFLSLALFVLMVPSCSPLTKTTDEGAALSSGQDAVELLKATRQDWVAGIVGGGAGSEYTFTIAIPEKGPVTFGAVTIDRAEHPAVLRKRGAPVTQAAVVPVAGDTLDLRVSVRRSDAANVPDTDSTTSTGAIINYSIGGEQRSLPVDRIERLAPQNRP